MPTTSPASYHHGGTMLPHGYGPQSYYPHMPHPPMSPYSPHGHPAAYHHGHMPYYSAPPGCGYWPYPVPSPYMYGGCSCNLYPPPPVHHGIPYGQSQMAQSCPPHPHMLMPA